MVAKRKSVEGGAATKSGANSGLLARLRKAGRTCAPEKIWAVVQAALGGQKPNLQAALEAARGEAAKGPKPRTLLKLVSGRSREESGGAKAKAKAAAKQKALPAKKVAVKKERELVDLNAFEDVVDLIDAWMRMKGKVKRESSREPSAKREPGTKSEPRVKREPGINRELVNEIRRLGIIDLTEGEVQPRAAGRRPSSSGASPPRAKQASQASAAKGGPSASRSGEGGRRSISKSSELIRRSLIGKAISKRKAVEKSPKRKMPQGLKSLNKLASKCDPQRLWSILKAAAHENKPSASIGAALRAAKDVATTRGHGRRQAEADDSEQ